MGYINIRVRGFMKGEVVFIVRGGIPGRAKRIDDRRVWE
jgi:hypothetical protein